MSNMHHRRPFLQHMLALLASPSPAAMAAAMAAGHAGAATAPVNRPLAFLVGFPPGGGPDLVLRLLLENLRRDPGLAGVVENKTGAGGRIALIALKNAEADGGVFALSPSGPLTIYPHVYKDLAYDPRRDFSAVCKVCSFSTVIATRADAPYQDLAQFLAWARAHPAQANYGTPGAATSADVLGRRLVKASATPMTSVLYRGGPQLTQAVLSGEVAVAINLPSNFSELVKNGKLRLLAISTAARSPLLPQVPTLAEQGYTAPYPEDSIGLWARAGTPPAQMQRVQNAVAAALADSRLEHRLQQLGYLPHYQAGPAYEAAIADASGAWKDIIADLDYQALEAGAR